MEMDFGRPRGVDVESLFFFTVDFALRAFLGLQVSSSARVQFSFGS